MALSLTAEQKSVMTLFETTERYIIPDFQRAYSWEYSQCFQLYKDLTTSFSNKEDYFLGNILIARSQEDPKQPIVIDGQQRLITIWVMLKVLSVLMPDYTTLPKLIRVNLSLRSESLETKVISNVPEVSDANDILLVDGLDIDGMQGLPSPFSKCNDAHSLLLTCALFYKWFRDYQEKDKEELALFSDYLLEHVYLLPIEISGGTIDDATNRTLIIFETLNNRGLNLEDTDIFKSRLYAKAKIRKQEGLFMEQWVELNENCTKLHVSLEDVFRYYSHVLRGKMGITTSEISLRDFFVNSENAPLVVSDYDSVMRDLWKVIEVLEFLSCSHSANDKITVWLQILGAYTNVYPKYATIVYLFVHGTDDKDKFVDFLQNLVKYCYSYGSSTSVKFGIYNIIKSVSFASEYKCLCPNIKVSDFDYLGRLKNGLILLNFYIHNQDKVLLSYHFSKFYRKGMEYDTQEDWWNADWDKVDSLLSNYRVSGTQKNRSDIDFSDSYSIERFETKIPRMGYSTLLEKNILLEKDMVAFFKDELKYE